MKRADPEVEVGLPLSNDTKARLADAVQKALRDEGGPIVEDILDAGGVVESATIYADAIYATFVVDEEDYREVLIVDQTEGDGEPDE